ncbi:hypothetical protein TELCIR_19892 [Teladorsagia circumcincta]|uniref:Uncharacterized protein n=1 Tax=Teladorsagia circumcincta TaxID=45464 RepID=A0A2G9TLB7_TELCI|nr:hypothetical protein TELCIR_19892 [Teladorsagia circumcincta]
MNSMRCELVATPSVTIKVAARLTSPSGEFSEWMDGIGKAVHMTHNVTETVPHGGVGAVVSVRDEALQQKNADFIKTYVVLFCISAAIASIVEVTLVRRMFRIDPSRIRI